MAESRRRNENNSLAAKKSARLACPLRLRRNYYFVITMSEYASSLDAIIIGAGPAGIAMAYQLKYKLGFHDFTVYEKLDGVGGTWRTNTYPGWCVAEPERPQRIGADILPVAAIFLPTFTRLASISIPTGRKSCANNRKSCNVR